jgi:hypothetical protein
MMMRPLLTLSYEFDGGHFNSDAKFLLAGLFRQVRGAMMWSCHQGQRSEMDVAVSLIPDKHLPLPSMNCNGDAHSIQGPAGWA